MAKTISTFFTVLMLLLAPPSAAALATWNTLPGQPLYPIKRGLENAALVVLSPSFQAKSSLRSELVSRRTDEAVKLLSSSESTKGLDELRAEIDAAKLQASQANDPVARRIAVEKLISKLQAANQALETVSATPAPTTTTATPKSAGYVPRRPSTTGALPAAQTQTEQAPPQQQIVYVNQQETKVVYKTTLVSVVVQQQVINTQTQIQQDIQQLQQEAKVIEQEEKQQEQEKKEDKDKEEDKDHGQNGQGKGSDEDKDFSGQDSEDN